MGQQHSDLSHLPNVHYNPKCEVLEKAHDPHYGEIKVIRELQTSEKMILKEVVINTKPVFEAEASELIKRTNTKHPNIVNVIGFNFKEKQKFCSSYFKISVYIEDIAQTLAQQLESRKATGISFTDNEILFIADSILNALSHLCNQGLYHGDVRPLNIFTKERGFKLSDPALNAERGTTGLSLAILHNTKTFLAPELLSQVSQRRFDVSSDPHKADVFALGATLLGLATLTDSEDLFEHYNGVIRTNILNERLETVRLTYSEFTYELITHMLALNINSRPSVQELSNRLLPYRDQIALAYMNPGTPMGNFSSLVDFTFAGAGVKTEGELIKKSARLPSDLPVERPHHLEVPKASHHVAPVQEYHTPADDDLDARIRAALERSQATFKAIHSGSTVYSPTPQVGYPSQSGYSTTAHNTKIMEIGTNKEAELAKSSRPQDVSRPSNTYSSTNYPTTTSNYPVQSHHYTTTTTYNPVSQPHTGVYSAYTPSHDFGAHNANITSAASHGEGERLLKSSVMHQPTETYGQNPLTTHLISSSYVQPNTYAATTDVRTSSYVPPTTTHTHTHTAAPYNYLAQSGTQVAQPIQGYSNPTYEGRYSGSHVVNSVRPEDATNQAAGGETAKTEGHGPAGFTEQLAMIGFGKNY